MGDAVNVCRCRGLAPMTRRTETDLSRAETPVL